MTDSTPQALDSATFDQAIAEGVVLVDFWAPWCMPCQMLKPVLKELASGFADRARIVTVDTDQHADLAQRYGVRALPTLVLFKDGRLARQFVGLTKFDRLARAIEELLQAQPNQPDTPA
ncbi:MAG TPA: thioredoxin [Phycisphaerales bacterium]|nr:thioredoxin [Phycisphaerales bacterium]